MPTFNNSYSRMVAWLKVILPLVALGLLSTMFLISKSIDPTKSLTYAQVDLDAVMREQKISGPSFSSVTKDGAAITFSAESARPEEGKNRYSANGMVARIETPDGAVVDINAQDAMIDGSASQIDLTGGVTLVTSTKYTIHTPGLTTSMDATNIASYGPVTARGPLGEISAGQARISQQSGNSGTYLLVFKGGVKLVYDPPAEGEN
ncbi:hypothetical protein O2N63_02990 [Aliiroseovarius sp. KMU-50]|uniref:LPS export ABC transporter periplasmic protein LptC n=1 Tax=Aliiroseovarius salicola TaxID=3009082 RepID=A0ABT4VXQ2_9RHOB|nr:hypothetical protein [Aliiroseovarius sp. KMU-50]MDA5093043.1 hypothetical protein [Aliiroseovarius sp. KMU-50]